MVHGVYRRVMGCPKFSRKKINLFLPDFREMEEKNLRFFSSISRKSGKNRFIKNHGWFIFQQIVDNGIYL